jgi:single-stranded-DNA-specific exonuclease
VLKEKHLKLTLIDPRDGSYVEAIHFFSEFVEKIPHKAKIVFEMSVNSFRGNRNPQLMIRHIQPI